MAAELNTKNMFLLNASTILGKLIPSQMHRTWNRLETLQKKNPKEITLHIRNVMKIINRFYFSEDICRFYEIYKNIDRLSIQNLTWIGRSINYYEFAVDWNLWEW